MKRVARNTLVGFALTAGLMTLCVFIRPDGLDVNRGFSYFGDYRNTVVLYSAAFILYAYVLWRASEAPGFANGAERLLSLALKVMTVLVIGLVITPSNLVDSIHVFFGTALFLTQFVVSCWTAGWLSPGKINALLVVLETVSGLAAFYYLQKSSGFLLQSQAVFQLGFGILFVRLLAARA